jgi:hypothetical protein
MWDNRVAVVGNCVAIEKPQPHFLCFASCSLLESPKRSALCIYGTAF